jgi:hypothetical protein
MTAVDPPSSEVCGWVKSKSQTPGKQQCVKITPAPRRLPPNFSFPHFRISVFSL